MYTESHWRAIREPLRTESYYVMLMFTNVMIVKSRMEVYDSDDYDAGCVFDDYNVGR